MRHLWFAFCACLLVLFAQPLVASTFYVGTCRINAFADIQTAVNTVPAGSVIYVCAGTYTPSDTLILNKALTLQGIFSNNSTQVVIAMPTNGLTSTASSIATGGTVTAQIMVTSPGVILRNLTVDGSASSSNCPSQIYIGIFYSSGSGGTVSGVETRNQICSGQGLGIVAENGAGTSQTVTIQNSNVNGVGNGIWACSDQTPTTLTAYIRNNVVATRFTSVAPVCGGFGISGPSTVTGSISGNSIFPGTAGLYSGGGSTIPMSGNIVDGGGYGAYLLNATGVSGNTFVNNSLYGMAANGASTVTSNHVANSGTAGILLSGGGGATVKSNIVTQTPVGIEFQCLPGTVTGNTINGATTGIDQVPAAFTGVNTFYNVATVKLGGAC